MLRLLNIHIIYKRFNNDITLLLILILNVRYLNIIQKTKENE